MYTRCHLNGYRNRIMPKSRFQCVTRPGSRIYPSFIANFGAHFDDRPRTRFVNDLRLVGFSPIRSLERRRLRLLAQDRFGDPGTAAPSAETQARFASTHADPAEQQECPNDDQFPGDMNNNYAIARVPKEGDKLYLTIFWNNHKIRMERNRAETIGVTIARLKKSLGKVEIAKETRSKKNNADELPDYSVAFLTSLFKTFGEDAACEDAVANAAFISINDTLLKLFTNVPQLDKVRLLPRSMVDCPVTLTVKDDADEHFSEVSVEWLDAQGNLLGTNPVYVPSMADLGKAIKARVTNSLMKYDTFESNLSVVDPAPYCKWQRDRVHAFNTAPKATALGPLQDPRYDVRVVSFNILSPTYVAPSDPASFFNYCPPEFLDTDYRNRLIGREIYYLNPQILCLQECSYRVYTDHLTRILGQRFHSWVTIKGGNAPEGCAMFVNRNAFEPVETTGVCFKDVVRTERYKHVIDRICRNWLMFGVGAAHAQDNYFDKYHTVYQLACYRFAGTNKFIFVANTHLYFHPMANHIRLLQAYVLLTELESFKAHVSSKYGFDLHNDAYTVICGDFNCIPRESIHHLMTHGYVAYDHPDWKLGRRAQPQARRSCTTRTYWRARATTGSRRCSRTRTTPSTRAGSWWSPTTRGTPTRTRSRASRSRTTARFLMARSTSYTTRTT